MKQKIVPYDVNNAYQPRESPNSTNATRTLYTNAVQLDEKTGRRSMLQYNSQNEEHTFHNKKYEKGLHRVKLN